MGYMGVRRWVSWWYVKECKSDIRGCVQEGVYRLCKRCVLEDVYQRVCYQRVHQVVCIRG